MTGAAEGEEGRCLLAVARLMSRGIVLSVKGSARLKDIVQRYREVVRACEIRSRKSRQMLQFHPRGEAYKSRAV